MSDYLESLPTDEIPMDATESQIFDTLVKADTSQFFKIIHELRLALLAGAVFIFLNVEAVEKIIQNVIPYAKTSKTSSLFTKAAIFVVLVFTLQNISILM